MVNSAAAALSPCALAYMKAVVDPFGLKQTGQLPCIPDLFDMPSYKVNTTVRSVMHTGTNFFGFIVCNPFTNDNATAYAYASTANYTGTTVAAPGTLNVNSILDAQYPFGPAGVSYRSMRVVGCGVRVRYIGTVLNRGGRIATACLPFDPNINGLGITNILSFPDVILQQVDDKWHGCYFRAQLQSDMTYYQAGAVNCTDFAGHNRLAIMVESAAAGAAFEVEITRFLEFLPGGDGLSVPGVSRSDSDIQGLSWVRNILGSVSSSYVGQTAWNAALRSAQTVLPSLINSVVPGGGTAARLLQYSQPSIEEL